MTNKIQFMYVRDSKCPDRVMVVATQMLDKPGAIKVATAVNRVAMVKHTILTDKGNKVTNTNVEVFDAYSKQVGKFVVQKRLNAENPESGKPENFTFVNPSKEVPMKVYVLEQLAKDKSLQTHVRGLARQKLAEMAVRKTNTFVDDFIEPRNVNDNKKTVKDLEPIKF